MKSESKSINVDEPFLSQQAFRDFLKLPSEEPAPKIGIYDLLEVAKLVIRNELDCCGCSEKELISCRLEYQISKEENKELGEIYSVQWNQIPQFEKTTEDEEKISENLPDMVAEKNNPLPSEFMGKLTQRIDEVSPALDEARLIASRADFRTFSSLNCRTKCVKDTDGLRYRKRICNGQSYWLLDSQRKKILCKDELIPDEEE